MTQPIQATIQCPVCREGQMLIEPRLLASGGVFGCTHCPATVQLAEDSVDLVREKLEAVDAFHSGQERLKAEGERPKIG